MNARFAVIGQPITHSLSPLIHQQFAKQTKIALSYERIEGIEHQFERQVTDFFAGGGKGLNITLPFKLRAYLMGKTCTERCILAGAANTLWLDKNQLNADNTDGVGLLRDLGNYLELTSKNILIVGAGGAARGIIHPLLSSAPASITVACRSHEKAALFQSDFPQIIATTLEKISEPFDVIINATSAGVQGRTLELPHEMMAKKPFCYDLAYNQKQATSFVQYAHAQGCTAADGLGMLVEQAAESFYIWHEIRPKTDEVLTWLRGASY